MSMVNSKILNGRIQTKQTGSVQSPRGPSLWLTVLRDSDQEQVIGEQRTGSRSACLLHSLFDLSPDSRGH